MSGPGRSFCAMGVFGQLLVVFPEHAATLALTSAVNGVNACTRTLLPLVHRHLPRIFREAAGDQSAADARLEVRSRRMAATLPVISCAMPSDHRRGAREYRIDPNPLGITALHLTLSSAECEIRLTAADGAHAIRMGIDRWIESEADVPAAELHHGYPMRPARVVAAARWADPGTLEMSWIFVESAFRDTVTCRFEGNRIRYSRTVNVNSGPLSQAALTGTSIAR